MVISTTKKCTFIKANNTIKDVICRITIFVCTKGPTIVQA